MSIKKLFDELRAQGFIRARINGNVLELDADIKLNPKQKHTIEIVVDRFKIRDDLGLRLAESLETTLLLSEGIAITAPLDDSDTAEITFSSKFACNRCGYSLPELEPRLFSFNSPHGACSGCDGLGAKQFFDAQRVICNPSLSLAGAAIRGWDRRNAYYFQMIQSLGAHYSFDVESPFESLPEATQQIVLFGSGKEKIEFRYLNDRGDARTRLQAFEGIIPNLERRYRDTESAAIREELAKLLSTQACPDCNDTRLNVSARHVFIGDKTLPKISALPIGDAHNYFATLALKGQRAEIGAKILKEILQRLQFLVNVGLDYLTLARSAETLSGGEAQRIRLASQIGAGLMGVMYVLDEPSIGLHQRDNERLLNTLNYLRDLGNTVIVVEHDEEAIRSADYVVDIGPGAGIHGGKIVAEGTPSKIQKTPASLTGQYLSGKDKSPCPRNVLPKANNRSKSKAHRETILNL